MLQEAYVRAFGAIAGFRGEAAIATWLTRIVLNEAHGRLRRRKVTVGLHELEAAQESAQVLNFPGVPRSDGPEADAAHAQIRRLLEQAIDALPEAFRLVFILREVEELSVEETAGYLGLKPETVKTRLHRARRRVREGLDAQLADVMVGALSVPRRPLRKGQRGHSSTPRLAACCQGRRRRIRGRATGQR
ncbi:sigma-70 family RNA polymerase sigma factor [Phenylobacterium sp.]|uniref:sigma-70 family RNA polymerase sigma factor n=1 Tax=Phenylobacterium sp. TaxID=1871053 RepID=UPI002F42C9C7